jgi:hypothetical protein
MVSSPILNMKTIPSATLFYQYVIYFDNQTESLIIYNKILKIVIDTL